MLSVTGHHRPKLKTVLCVFFPSQIIPLKHEKLTLNSLKIKVVCNKPGRVYSSLNTTHITESLD